MTMIVRFSSFCAPAAVLVTAALAVASARAEPVTHTSTSGKFAGNHQVQSQNDPANYQIDAAGLSELLVLFVSWENAPTLPLPKDGTKADGGTQTTTNDPGQTTDPGTGTVTLDPEPATLISAIIGAGLLTFAGWRRRLAAAH
jgi:hypothetical protein